MFTRQKTTILVFVILLWLTSNWSWAQEKCGAPTLNVGDKWQYGSNGKKWAQEVISIEDDIYVIRYGNEIRGFDKKSMNFNFGIEDNRRTKFSGSRSKILDFPLYVGKKWFANISLSSLRRSVEQNILEEYFISSYEEIKVAAGTFKAFKIEYRQRNMASSKETARGTYWYAPEVKAIIKRVEKVSLATQDMELISYKLNLLP